MSCNRIHLIIYVFYIDSVEIRNELPNTTFLHLQNSFSENMSPMRYITFRIMSYFNSSLYLADFVNVQVHIIT